MEVQQQPTLNSRKPEIGENLSFVNGQQLRDGFHLNEELVIHDEVHTVSTLNPSTVINQRLANLTGNRHSRLGQLVLEAALVG